MTKRELVIKIHELLNAAERFHAAVDTALEEARDMIKELEAMPETVEEIEDDELEVRK